MDGWTAVGYVLFHQSGLSGSGDVGAGGVARVFLKKALSEILPVDSAKAWP